MPLKQDELLEVIEQFEAALSQMGRWAFAEKYRDPRELDRARKEAA